MAWDFTADSDIQRSMAQNIKEKSESLDGEFSNMYEKISGLGTYWVGEDYNAFSSGCSGYKTALGDMTSSMRMYAGHFEKIASGTDDLASALISIVQNMTTRYGAGGGPVVDPNTQTPGQTTPDQTPPTQTGDDDRNVGGGTFGDDKTGDDDRNVGGGSFDDSDKKVESGDELTDTYTSVTLKSGDIVNINDRNMRFYGAYQDERGTSVNMYADAQGNLFYGDGSPVMLSRVASTGQTVKIEANLNNVGTYVMDSRGSASWKSYWQMNDADGNVIKEKDIASSVVYVNGEQAPNITDNDNTEALISGDNTITQEAKLKDSYVNASSGDVINGHSVAVPTSMQGLSTYIANGTDVIRIDPHFTVEWDPSSALGNGYKFDTASGPVYLMKSDDGSYYNICDQYGNIINDKKFTPDGFNVQHGNWK